MRSHGVIWKFALRSIASTGKDGVVMAHSDKAKGECDQELMKEGLGRLSSMRTAQVLRVVDRRETRGGGVGVPPKRDLVW